MTDLTSRQIRLDGARRRLHRRVANEQLRDHGVPKAETMKKLNRAYAASVGNRKRWARVRALKRDMVLHDLEYPLPLWAGSMHRGILARIMKMTYHERMDRARLSMAHVLMENHQSYDFTVENFENWKTRTLRALVYQRGKYRTKGTHTETQAKTHVMLELVIDFIRQGSEPLLRKWLHSRQVAERAEEIARIKLHNPTSGRRI